MIDWNKITTVLLDMDGTLLDLHFDNYFWLTHLPKRYAEIHQLDPDTTKKALRERFEKEYGSLNWYCTQYWAKTLDVDIVSLKHEVAHKISPLPFVIDFLDFLKAEGKRVVLATNAHQESFDIKMNVINLRPYFEYVAISHDFGAPKERQHYWTSLQDQFPFDPKTTLFIDDNENVLNAAAQFGIQHRLKPMHPDSQRTGTGSDLHPCFRCYSELLPALREA